MALTKVTGQVIKNTTDVTVGVLTVTNTLAVGGTVSIGGTLTYEDVTNVDAVGLITARNGIVVGSGITLSKDGDIFATGITTVSGNVKVGTGITLSPDGDGFYTGVVTATTFSGSLAASNLTGTIADARFPATLPAISGANLTNLDASDLASGTVPTARLGSGTASSSTFLRGDSTFAAVTSTTINSNADNRVITGSDTADTLNAESLFTFDGLNINQSMSSDNRGLKQVASGNNYIINTLNANRSSANDLLGMIETRWNGTHVADLSFHAGSDTTNKDDGYIKFRTSASAGGITERLRITSAGKVGINEASPQQQLHVHDDTIYNGILINGNAAPRMAFARSTTTTGEWSVGIDGTNGNNFAINSSNDNSNNKIIIDSSSVQLVAGSVSVPNGNVVMGASYGIDFSAQTATSASGASATGEVLDHYEEGTWTPTLTTGNGGAFSSSYCYGYYTRVGRIVHAHFVFNTYSGQYSDMLGSGSSSDGVTGGGLPFPSANNSQEYYHGDLGFYALNFPSSLSQGTLNMYAYQGSNSSNFYFYLPSDNAASALIQVGQFGQGYIRGCLHYLTAY